MKEYYSVFSVNSVVKGFFQWTNVSIKKTVYVGMAAEGMIKWPILRKQSL